MKTLLRFAAALIVAPVFLASAAELRSHAEWLDFRAYQISAIQKDGSSFSGLASWNPRYVHSSGWRLGLDFGFSMLHFRREAPSWVMESAFSLGHHSGRGWGWEAGIGRQQWLSPGEGFLTLGANLLYAPEKLWLDAIDRFIVGYQTLSILGDRTHQIRVGVNFPLGKADSKPAASRVVVADRCRVRPLTVQYSSRALRADEWGKLPPLPYIDRPDLKRHMNTLSLGQMTGLANGIPYIKDTQVVFAIDLVGLPAKKSILDVPSAMMKMGIRKVSSDGYTGTEMLCFLNEGVCSGELIESGNWRANINPKVFPNGARPPNDFFAKQYLDRVIGQVLGEKIYAAEVSLPVNELLRNSRFKSVRDMLYEETPENAVMNRTLYIAVADDTFVSNDARLELVLLENPCLAPPAPRPSAVPSPRPAPGN